jgi:hypothetical protein
MSWDLSEEPGSGARRPRQKGAWLAFGVAVALVLVVLGLHFSAGANSSEPHGALVSSRQSQERATRASRQKGSNGNLLLSGLMAPNGSFVTLDGTTKEVSSYRGKPVMVWFVVGGCASCAVSIPAVSRALPKLRADGIQVLTLGLWGDFPPGSQGLFSLAQFGRLALDGYAGLKAGTSIQRPGWVWGMASKSLSLAYDPSGTPDVYALIGPAGHIRYRNSVPASTIPSLLKAASELHARDAKASQARVTAQRISGRQNPASDGSASRSERRIPCC